MAAFFLAGAFLVAAFFLAGAFLVAAFFLAGAFFAGAAVSAFTRSAIRSASSSKRSSSSSKRSDNQLICLEISRCTSALTRSEVSRPRSSSVCTAFSASLRRISPFLTIDLTIDSACLRDMSVNSTPASTSRCNWFFAMARG